MIKLILTITLFLLAGCQTNFMDLLPGPEVHSQTVSEVTVAEEPRKLDVVHPDQFLGTTAPAGLDARPFQEELSNIATAESKRIVQERIAEEKRLAEEQRIKEENERIAAEAAKIAAAKEAEAALAAEQAAKEKQQAANTQQESNSAAPAPVQTQTQTDGFNFKGHHFPLSSFSGSGKVPAETPYVFQWTELPSHYLIERISPAGRVIQQVQMGDKIVVNGNTYTVHHIKRGVVNDDTAMGTLLSTPSTISFQTCEKGKGWNGLSLITIWYAS